MSLSGVFLIIFLTQHLFINLTSLIPDGGKVFNIISHFMGNNPIVQFVLQPVLILGVVVHFSMGIYLEIQNQRSRQISYVGGDNQKYSMIFSCSINKNNKQKSITIFEVTFNVQEYIEACTSNTEILENTYFVDLKNVTRRSRQYHGPALGYLTIERLDR